MEKNRSRLIHTMLQLGRFTEDQLLSVFSRNRPLEDVIIDSDENVVAFLRRLRDSGTLDFSNGYYIVPE